MQTEMYLPPASHDYDPISSHIAEEQHKPKRVQNITIVKSVLRNSFQHLTSRELYQYAESVFNSHRIDKYEVARRLSDLKKMGLIDPGKVRKCRVCGKKLGTYKLL